MKNPYYTISNIVWTNNLHSKSYRLIQDDDNYIISFISGELAGREKFVRVNEEEFNKLKNEEITLSDLLKKYNTG